MKLLQQNTYSHVHSSTVLKPGLMLENKGMRAVQRKKQKKIKLKDKITNFYHKIFQF